MSQRNVAEIIGWEFHCIGRTVARDQQGHVVDSRATGYWCEPGVSMSDGSPPNVDDLLLWLRDNGYGTTAESSPSPQFDHPCFVSVWHIATGVTHKTEGPTLLAALEAAVQAIDSAQERP